MDILKGLNQQQLEAVQTTEGYVRVIAGAGSGKTKLLVSRYAYLVKDYGIDTANILCVTFTNKAAGEMKKRIRSLIGAEYDTTLICTYHGFCARILRENPEKLFLNKGFQILDTSQQKSILEEIYQKYELKLDHASFESILEQIAREKSRGDYVPNMCDPKPCRILARISTQDHRIIEEFLQRQKAMYALDFNDLLNYALYLLETNAEIREKWQDRLNYIMVDEFQDSSSKEMKLVELLSEKYRNLMIVGDPDQNIYEWRGSDVKLLVDFDRHHPGTQTIFLNQNYRSTPQILRCANFLIDKNTLRLKKDLFTRAEAGAEVYHYHSKSDAEENGIIADTIRDLVKDGAYTYGDFAILYRSSFLSRVIEKKLVESNIPYDIVGGVKFYRRMEVLDIIAYLRLIAFDDDVSFKRIVNTPRRRFGRGKLAMLEDLRDHEISAFAESDRPGLFSTLKNHTGDPAFRSSGAAEFVSFVEAMRQASGASRISELVGRVCAESGYEQYIRELGDEERLENLAEFKRIAVEFESSFGEALSLGEFLQQIALLSAEDDDKAREAVKLMTIHSSKGLEFPVVFVVGFTEGIFPSSKTIEERKRLGLKEERRLCYVAITRARERLFLMDSEGYSQNGIKKLPSRFLDEIGEENYTRVGVIEDELAKESKGYVHRTSRQFFEETAKQTGETVEHHVFGRGTIVSRDEKRGSYVIKFDKLPQPRTISKDYFAPKDEPAREIPAASREATAQEATAQEATAQEASAQEAIVRKAPAQESPAQEASAQEAPAQEAPAQEATAQEAPAQKLPEAPCAKEPVPPSETPRETDPAAPSAHPPTEPDAEDTREEPIGVRPASPQTDESEFEEQERMTAPMPRQPEAPAPSEHTASSTVGKEEDARTSIDPEALKQRLAEADNLWKRDDVPHEGWRCIGVTDLGSPCGICEMCGYQIIRYVHHMVHERYSGVLNVGCVCAGKMEGDVEGARKRERDFKNKQTRRENFQKRTWKHSRNGNPYLKIRNHVVVLYRKKQGDGWKYSIDQVFCAEVFPTRDQAVDAAFEALEQIAYTN